MSHYHYVVNRKIAAQVDDWLAKRLSAKAQEARREKLDQVRRDHYARIGRAYVPQIQKDVPACPLCGGGVIHMPGEYDGCGKCLAVWEKIPAGEVFSVDGERMAFHQPCDNCAYRRDSPERADPVKWAELQAKLANGDAFFCHKGVPFKLDVRSPEQAFLFPKDAASKCGYDIEKMRHCRGYLNAVILPQMRAYAR